MAGAGFRTFVDGEVLTAAQVNTYLMQQAVMVFADASARSTAIAAPSEGMVTYLTGSDVLEYYDGAAWQPILDQDVISAKGDLIVGTADDTVQALTVGSNEQRLVADSGETTGLKYVADTTNYAIGAKGDLLVGTAADTLTNLAVGTDDYVLTADSNEASGLKWAAAAGGGGKVLQVVQTIKTDAFTSSSTSFANITGLSASITPSNSANKVLIMVSTNCSLTRPGSTYSIAQFQITGGNAGTFIGDASGSRTRATFGIYASSEYSPVSGSTAVAFSYLDSPATTSSTTYQVQVRYDEGSGTSYASINRTRTDTDNADFARSASSIILFEIEG